MPDRPRSRLAAARDSLAAAAGVVLGLVPHVLHHVGLIVGAAFVTGAGGNALFYGLGLLLSVPMLRRSHRRFGTWLAPTIAVAVFTVLFLLSALVIGPNIDAGGGADQTPRQPAPSPTQQHGEHHS